MVGLSSSVLSDSSEFSPEQVLQPLAEGDRIAITSSSGNYSVSLVFRVLASHDKNDELVYIFVTPGYKPSSAPHDIDDQSVLSPEQSALLSDKKQLFSIHGGSSFRVAHSVLAEAVRSSWHATPQSASPHADHPYEDDRSMTRVSVDVMRKSDIPPVFPPVRTSLQILLGHFFG